VTLVIVAVGALVLASAAYGAAAVKTPGGAAYCGVTEGEPPYALVCWTPNDGFEISMARYGRPTHDYNPLDRGDHEVAGRLLGFGERWAVRGYWNCASRRTGLTCWNRSGHGWWLGRYRGYRVF
jgi:hypothetical protein